MDDLASPPELIDAASYRLMQARLDEQSLKAEIPHVHGCLLCVVELFERFPYIKDLEIRRTPSILTSLLFKSEPGGPLPDGSNAGLRLEMKKIFDDLQLRAPMHVLSMLPLSVIDSTDSASDIARKFNWTGLAVNIEAREIRRQLAEPAAGPRARPSL